MGNSSPLDKWTVIRYTRSTSSFLSLSKSVARAISSINSERLPVASEISFCPSTKS